MFSTDYIWNPAWKLTANKYSDDDDDNNIAYNNSVDKQCIIYTN
jgi:hypothetical protein